VPQISFNNRCMACSVDPTIPKLAEQATAIHAANNVKILDISRRRVAISRYLFVEPTVSPDKGALTLPLREEIVERPAKGCIAAWRTSVILTPVQDFFGDGLDFNASTFEDLVALNHNMMSTITKCTHLFEDTNPKARRVVATLVSNLSKLGSDLGRLTDELDGPASKYEEGQARLAGAEKKLAALFAMFDMRVGRIAPPHPQLHAVGVTTSWYAHLLEWVRESTGTVADEPVLRYQRTRDGKHPADFHRCVDGHPRLLIVIRESPSGFLFGGFTSIGIRSSGDWQMDAQAFLFTLISPKGCVPTKYASRGTMHGVYWNTAYQYYAGTGGCLGLGGSHTTYACTSNSDYADIAGEGPVFASSSGGWRIAEVLAYTL
jgi:hypothetical protein